MSELTELGLWKEVGRNGQLTYVFSFIFRRLPTRGDTIEGVKNGPQDNGLWTFVRYHYTTKGDMYGIIEQPTGVVPA